MFGRLLTALLVTLGLVAGRIKTPQLTDEQPRYLVVIVMDGFREDYLKLAPMRHLHWLMGRGMFYDRAWVGQIESTTPAGHATIATGVYPKRHEVVGFGWRWPESNAFTFMPTDTREVTNGDLHRAMTQDGIPTISDLFHQQDPHNVVVALSAEKYYAAATMGSGADYILYGKDDQSSFDAAAIPPDIPPESTHWDSVRASDSTINLQDGFAGALAVQMATTVRPKALLVNLPAPDIAGHYYGGPIDPADMATIIKGTDGAIGMIIDAYRRMGILKQTLFLVTADHGMVSNRRVVPIHAMYRYVAHTLNMKPLEQEYPSNIGSVWLNPGDDPAKFASAMMAQHFKGIDGVLYRTSRSSDFQPEPKTAATLPADVLKADLDLANTEAGVTGADVLFIYGEDATGLYVKNRSHWGSHGGFTWGSQHIPLVIAGPGIRHGVSHFPAQLVDVAPTLEHLMGLPVPAGLDGVLLNDALQSGFTAAAQAQHQAALRRLPDVKAIERFSALESKAH